MGEELWFKSLRKCLADFVVESQLYALFPLYCLICEICYNNTTLLCCIYQKSLGGSKMQCFLKLLVVFRLVLCAKFKNHTYF